MIGKLALEDGTILTGQSFGAPGTCAGEVVFNTAMTGYQEVFTDPSYCGQIVTMTFPLIGNYGINAEDYESVRPFLSGVVVKELPRRPSNYRSVMPLAAFLQKLGIVGLCDVDTRALTRRIRTAGALRGVLSTEIADEIELVRLAQSSPMMSGANLIGQVAAPETRVWSEALDSASRPAPMHVVVIDCGIKRNILRHLAGVAQRVTVVPGLVDAARIRELRPDALVIGNGPGDPAAVTETAAAIRELIGDLPMLGVCLGHQLLALALGAKTYKLSFGHHGANLPVRNEPAGRVEITSQNHGFAVERGSLERVGGQVTHVNLNDGSVEGFAHPTCGVAAVQFHPEASPGPHDASYVFAHFVECVAKGRPVDADVFS